MFSKALILKTRLACKGSRKVLAFDLASMGELQFIEPVLLAYTARHPTDLCLVVHNGDTVEAFKDALPQLDGRILHVSRSMLNSLPFPEIDLFLTTEQYDRGLNDVYSISMFHGHAAKGLSFTPQVVTTFDAFFMIGPVHRDTYYEFVNEFLKGIVPENPYLYDVGYPKSDKLINQKYDNFEISRKLSLKPDRKTILYAPAFNEGASLREHGVEIIETLAGQTQFNVVVKLPIECWRPVSDFRATGGVNWFNEIHHLAARYPNLKLYSEYQIDPLLACADILVTCVSSVSFEFLAIGKPVIFIDTPKFFQEVLKKRFSDKNTDSWANRTTVNGGREFGMVISDIQELPKAVQHVLDNLNDFPRQKERLKTYLLFNPGKGTEAAVKKLEELLAANVRTRRTCNNNRLMQVLMSKIQSKLNKRLQTVVNFVLNGLGYSIHCTGEGYIDPSTTIRSAQKENLSLCEYLESRETDPRKKGRRDRIIKKMEENFHLENRANILEIGPGTGMYLEKIIDRGKPKRYEIYETNPGWVKFLREKFSKNQICDVVVQHADGETLQQTSAETFDLVHAHGVFVYIPILSTFSYIREAARVLKPGGYLVFDCYLDTHFKIAEVQSWLSSRWRFPVIFPETLLMEFINQQGLKLQSEFSEVHAASRVNYLIFKKTGL